MALKSVSINCKLKPSPAPSSTSRLLSDIDRELVKHGVGNEDGAHHVTAELAQGLTDVGFTVPASASTYWVGEAMGSRDYLDLPDPPEGTAQATATAAANAAHLARLLREHPYPSTS